jgi:hypothetical protein
MTFLHYQAWNQDTDGIGLTAKPSLGIDIQACLDFVFRPSQCSGCVLSKLQVACHQGTKLTSKSDRFDVSASVSLCEDAICCLCCGILVLSSLESSNDLGCPSGQVKVGVGCASHFAGFESAGGADSLPKWVLTAPSRQKTRLILQRPLCTIPASPVARQTPTLRLEVCLE